MSSLDFDLDTQMSRLERERLDRAEALQARIMAKIERLEDSMLGQD